jgi:tetratricopeptide (TPR) repeat protein
VDEEASNREALAYCHQRLEEDPADGISWILKGNCHRRLEEIENAVEAYRQAVLLGEVSSHANYYWGSCLVELGRIDEAISPLEAQLKISPDHLDALFLLGLCYHVMDTREQSNPLLDRVRDLDTKYYEEMFAKYADILAMHSEDPMIKQGLIEAARTLRRND